MSSFKEMVAKDRDVFINFDEFGEEHDVEGAKIIVVLEDDQIEDIDEGKALSQATLIMFAKTEELPVYRNQGETLYIDDVGYTVQTWLEEMGITKVTLTLPEGY